MLLVFLKAQLQPCKVKHHTPNKEEAQGCSGSTVLVTWERRSLSPNTLLLARQVVEEDDSEGVVEGWKQPVKMELSHLDGKKPVDLQIIFNTFSQLFTQKPGLTGVG